jgi:hypothetical protein
MKVSLGQSGWCRKLPQAVEVEVVTVRAEVRIMLLKDHATSLWRRRAARF